MRRCGVLIQIFNKEGGSLANYIARIMGGGGANIDFNPFNVFFPSPSVHKK